ncbi:Uncharacterized protein HZ326_26901 [Fusarium oxysporum f. sp. albedinis]|nr:Uncharacterized protein HZ326_26901 [Fusarium oxysporum f. sp. albedinis]
MPAPSNYRSEKGKSTMLYQNPVLTFFESLAATLDVFSGGGYLKRAVTLLYYVFPFSKRMTDLIPPSRHLHPIHIRNMANRKRLGKIHGRILDGSDWLSVCILSLDLSDNSAAANVNDAVSSVGHLERLVYP